MKKTWVLLLLTLILPFVSCAGLQSESWPAPAKLQEYGVLRVVDGDTIVVEKLGKVRYIGVNTPEIEHADRPGEYYGPEAAKANRRLVEGKRVKLELDVQKRDRYGRILAYVYTGSIFVNAWLVEAGYAQVMTVPPNVKYMDLFIKLQREARRNGRGLWARPADQPRNRVSAQAYWGNRRSFKFHYPWCKWARKINPRNLIYFRNRNEALDAGYAPCKECKP